MKKLKALAVIFLFLSLSAAKAVEAAAGERIYALPLAGNIILLPGLFDMSLTLVPDRARDSVNGKVSVCKPVTNMDSPRRRQYCQTILFNFPALRYDASLKAVLLGAQIVALDRGSWHGGWTLDDALKPEFRLVEKPARDGFAQKFLELALVCKVQEASR